MDAKVAIDRLNCADDWPGWKFQMKHLLKMKKLWEYVTEEAVQPGIGSSSEAIAAYHQNFERAFSWIALYVGKSQLYLITNTESPAEAWKLLCGHFDKNTTANKLYLKKQFYRCEMKESESVESHLRKMKELTDQLQAISVEISEEDQVMTLLGSLPPSYRHLVTSLEASSNDLTLQSVRQALLNEEQRRGGDAETVPSTALTTTQEKKYKVQCHGCGGYGHIKRFCKKKSKTKAMNTAQTAGHEPGLAFCAHNPQLSKQLNSEWIVDSGASRHMCYDASVFEDYHQFSVRDQVRLGDGRVIEAVGCGNVRMTMMLNPPVSCTLKNVLYVPQLSCNLFSVSSAVEQGHAVKFMDDKCWIETKSGTRCGCAEKIDKLYILKCTTAQLHSANATKSASNSSDLILWHQRMGHLNSKSLKTLPQLANGIEICSSDELPLCSACVEGKMSRLPFKTSGIRCSEPLELIHTDVCGPMQNESVGRSRYYLTFIDDCTRYTWVYFLRNKSEVVQKFKEFEAFVTNQSGRKIKRLRSDNGGEYVNHEMKALLKEKGIRHELTVPHTPQQNGVAERKNRSLMDCARSMLNHAELPKKLWAEAVSTAAYIQNRAPSAALKGSIPFTLWFGRKPNLKHLRVFGCVAFAHVVVRQKLDNKAEKLRFVGYGGPTKGFRLYNESTGQVVLRKDVIFSEQDFGKYDTNEVILGDAELEPKLDEPKVEEPKSSPVRQPSPEVKSRPQRERRPPVRYCDEFCNIHYALIADPLTLTEALQSENAMKWQNACDEEYNSLLANDTWELVELPKGRQAVGCKWVFRTKYNSDGSVSRFKSRLVAKGFSQSHGVDYDETYSPTLRLSSLRLLLAIAVEKKLLVHQMDVNNAFLNGNLCEEIYMSQPEGYVKPGEETLVCKLKRSLYGLKQAPRCWNETLTRSLKNLGFNQTSDLCVFSKQSAIVAVYVDDLIIMCESDQEMKKIKSQLMECFQMKDLGELSFILGIKVEKMNEDHSVLQLHQQMYILNVLKRFALSDVKPVSTPCDTSVNLKKEDGSKSVDAVNYQAMVGSLMYIAMATRPDIAYAVSLVSRYCSSPTETHLTAVKRIYRYLKGTLSLVLQFKSTSGTLVGYSDASWASDQDDRRSTSGVVFMMCGGAISWLSKKQPTVTLSTAESEYVSLCAAAQEATWLRSLLNDLVNLCDPTVIFEDNQSCIALSRGVQHSRSKHIDIKFHFIRECVAKCVISVQYCCSDLMIADILTKPLPRSRFADLRAKLGLCEL